MTTPNDFFFTSQDGISLYAADYPAIEDCGLLPVVCLPGLTRSSTDFTDLAALLSAKRRVICPDLRGRGKSDNAPNPESYTPLVEAGDVLGQLAALGVQRAIYIGTSRGGLISILTPLIHPSMLAGVVLNDIGCELAPAGLARILSYAGQSAVFSGWSQAAAAFAKNNQSQFPKFGDADWLAMAKRCCIEWGGEIRMAYDPQIGVALKQAAELTKDQPPADLWGPFQALANIPCALIHGELSDLLTSDIVQRMKQAKPDMIVATVPDRGHAPLLDEPQSLEAIEALLAFVDGQTQ
jgi:pimeloyl-ACP methyl ester carboxylesterase